MRKEWANAISADAKRQGNLIRKIRESAGLTLRQLAMQVGISHPAISQLEHGKLDLPRSRIEAIVKACGHSTEDFDKLMGKAAVAPDYRDECLSIVKALDEETVQHLYQLLKRLMPTASISGRRLEVL